MLEKIVILRLKAPSIQVKKLNTNY